MNPLASEASDSPSVISAKREMQPEPPHSARNDLRGQRGRTKNRGAAAAAISGPHLGWRQE